MERAARELSANDKWILLQGLTFSSVVGTALSFVSGPVGEGTFAVPDDRWSLAPVIS